MPVFTDVAQEAGVALRWDWGDAQMDNIVEGTGGGCTWLDYDHDGWMDLFVTMGAPTEGVSTLRPGAPRRTITDHLFRNTGKGTFLDVTAKAGVGDPRFTTAALAADYDRDGDTDLYLTNYGRNTLYRNNGDGTFTDVTEAAGVGDGHYGMGGAWLDYDGDGDLDLYLVNYLEFDAKYRLYYDEDLFPGPLAYPPQASILYRNEGSGRFVDVTASSPGLIPPSPGRGMGALVADFDGDGTLDLFAANDASENRLFLHRQVTPGGWRVAEEALLAGVAFTASGDAAASMGGDVGDIDRDGRLDLVVPNDKFNNVFLAVRPGQYEDRTAALGVAEASGQFWSWGADLADLDDDGDLDLVFATGHGHILHDTTEPLILLQVPRQGRPYFLDARRAAGAPWLRKRIARGLCAADYDNDGDVDYYLVSLDQPSALLRNDQRLGNHWLEVQLEGTRSNRDAIGARVTVKTARSSQVAVRLSLSSFVSQNDPRLHFGLGRETKIDRVEIRWPSGQLQQLAGVPVDRLLQVKEP